jgi:hypothetical protein
VNALTRRVEADARSDAEVAAWVSAQNRLTWQRAGHVSGKPMDQALGEIADMWAFAARWMQLKLQSVE